MNPRLALAAGLAVVGFASYLIARGLRMEEVPIHQANSVRPVLYASDILAMPDEQGNFLIDDMLDDSFPASDPPSHSNFTSTGGPLP